MERMIFTGIGSLLENELQGRITVLEALGKSHLEALEILLKEIQDQIDGFVVTYQNTIDFGHFQSAWMQTDSYVKQLKWFDQYGYPPRIHKVDFDFDDIRAKAREYTVKSRQISYLEQVLNEYQAVARWDRTPDKAKFEVKLEAEIKALKMAVVFEKKPDGKKLVWYGKPSEFGYLFLQLQSKGWIGLQERGEIVYSEFARVCLELFEFTNETTVGNLAKELNPNSNSLSDDSRTRFNIPFPNEMNPSKGRKVK